MQWLIEARKRDTKLPQLIRAAVKLFVEKGIEATTTKEIAELAEVAEGTLYRHFKSKDEMAFTLFITHMEAFTQELDKVASPLQNTKDKLRAVIQCYFAFFESEPDLFKYLLFSEHKELKNYPITMRHPYHVIRDILEDGIKKGFIPDQNVILSSAYIIGIVIRVSIFRHYGSIEENLLSYVDSVTEACWKVIS